MTGSGDSGDPQNDEPAWHERTSTVVGASVGALAVIGLLWLLISYMVGGSDDPSPASQYYIEPSASGSSTEATTTATSTETITSTSPPATTDIDPGNTSATTTSGTDTSGTSTTPFNPSNLPHTHTSSTDGDTSTHRPPRFNVTRTLYPFP